MRAPADFMGGKFKLGCLLGAAQTSRHLIHHDIPHKVVERSFFSMDNLFFAMACVLMSSEQKVAK